jgi:hypothetical protein
MAWNIDYYLDAVPEGAGNGVRAGVFLPLASLPGIQDADEIDDLKRESKVVYAIATLIHERLSLLPNKLSLATARSTPTGVGENRINQSFSLTSQFWVDFHTQQIGQIPYNGSNYGLVSIAAVFPDASFVVNEGQIIGPGVVIPFETLQEVGGSTFNQTTVDARNFINALYHSMVNELAVGGSIVAVSRGAVVGFVPPANFTGTNAITGLTPEQLETSGFFSMTYGLTVQLLLDQATQTFDIAA